MRTKSPDKSVRKCQKAVTVTPRIRRSANRGRRNDGSPSTKPNPWKIPACACGGTKFAVVGSDGGTYFAVQCESCRKEYVFRVQGRKLTMLRQID